MYIVGLDVHAKRSSMCILDENGKLVKHLEVKGAWARMLQVVDEQVPRPFAVCFEASCGYGYLHDQLAKRAERVTVAHPGQLRLIFRSKKKNDRVDADKLAKLLLLKEVPAVHVPGMDVRAWRGLINYRRKLIGRRAAVKTQVRAFLRGLGIAVGVKGGLWTKKGVAWLTELALLTSPADAVRRDVMVDDLTALEEKVRRVERELNRIGRAHPGVTLLQTIPGVGPRTAEAFVAHVDDVRRFARVKQVGSYFGLGALPGRVGGSQPPGPHHQGRAGGRAVAGRRGGVAGPAAQRQDPRVLRPGDAQRPGAQEDRAGGDGASPDAGDGGDAAQRGGVARTGAAAAADAAAAVERAGQTGNEQGKDKGV